MNKIIEEPDFKCEHCGSETPHNGHCPSVKAIEYFKDGTIKRVEYTTGVDYHPMSLPPTVFGPSNPWQQATWTNGQITIVKGRTE